MELGLSVIFGQETGEVQKCPQGRTNVLPREDGALESFCGMLLRYLYKKSVQKQPGGNLEEG